MTSARFLGGHRVGGTTRRWYAVRAIAFSGLAALVASPTVQAGAVSYGTQSVMATRPAGPAYKAGRPAASDSGWSLRHTPNAKASL